MSIATISAIINWSIIMITQLKFRKKVAAGEGPNELAGKTGQEALDALHFKLPFARVMPYIVLAFLAGVVVVMCFSPSYLVAVIIGPVWLAILLIAYQATHGKK